MTYLEISIAIALIVLAPLYAWCCLSPLLKAIAAESRRLDAECLKHFEKPLYPGDDSYEAISRVLNRRCRGGSQRGGLR